MFTVCLCLRVNCVYCVYVEEVCLIFSQRSSHTDFIFILMPCCCRVCCFPRVLLKKDKNKRVFRSLHIIHKTSSSSLLRTRANFKRRQYYTVTHALDTVLVSQWVIKRDRKYDPSMVSSIVVLEIQCHHGLHCCS